MKKLLYTLAAVLVPSLVLAQTPTENYIKNTTYQVETTTGSVSDDNKIETITYFDGLGRPKQSIAKQAGGNKQDIITPVIYDEFGRQVKDYLPYADPNQTSGSNLSYRQQEAPFFTAINNRYLAKFPDDINASLPNPFSEKNLEASPLGRVISQASPGYDWRLGGGNEIEFDYKTNVIGEVRLFGVNLTTAYEPTLVSSGSGYYTAGELYKTTIRDENHEGASKNHTTEEFKDKQGRVVLKRTYNYAPPLGEMEGAHDTYYVYDDYGNLTFVIPPKVNTADVVSSIELNELCYQYRYDSRNRLIEKKIPGKGLEEIVYNKIDQPILTRDSKLKAQNRAIFTKYDAYGRAVYTGMVNVSSATTRTTLQNQANAATAQFEKKSGMPPITVAGTALFYTNNAYPKDNIEEIYTINFYDVYEYGQPLAISGSNIFGDAMVNKPQGLSIGSWVKVLDTGQWIKSVIGYDKIGRVIYTKTINDYLSTTDIVQTLYDFTGKPLKVRSSHQKNSGNIIVTIDNFIYDHMGRLVSQSQCIGDFSLNTDCSELAGYTDIELTSIVTSTTNITASNSITLKDGFYIKAQSTGSGLSFSAKIIPLNELISENHYDELGQLDRKKVGNKATAPLQTVDYTYNIRGWLKQINNPANLGNDLFGFRLNYNTISHHTPNTNKELYNGNISETEWRTANTDNSLHWYKYDYDGLNRLTNATDNLGKLNETLNYDKNGNITTLVRLGHIVGESTIPDIANSQHFGTMDNLVYTYETNSNKLKQVLDNGDDTYGFKDSSVNNQDYWYDANGNMTKDLNKGIVGANNTDGILYNHLNLPSKVIFSGTNKFIDYIYDATGVKLKKKVTDGSSITETFYAGNYVYEGSSLKFFNHPEGYFDVIGVSNGKLLGEYVYQYKDHLGNIRLSYSDANNNGAIEASTEILEENNYYPFGLKHKGYNGIINSTNIALKRKFGGMEYQDELDLNWYDISARNYDPALGRWMNIDPLADKFPNMTPYNYAINNPLSFIDSDGKSPDPILSGVIQKAIQSAPIARVIGRINNAHHKVFGKGVYDNSNTVLASIPLEKKYIFQEGVWNAISGRNELNFTATFNAFGTEFNAAGYYAKKSRAGLFNIGDINIRKTSKGGRFTTDIHGNSGYIVDLTNGSSTIIRLSFADAQTHEVFEKILNKTTDSYMNSLIENNPALKELFELAGLSDEVHSLYASFNKDNPYDANSEQGKKYLKVLNEYTKRRNAYKDQSAEQEFWQKVQGQLDAYYNRTN